jgi:hypothetical protein
MMVVTEEPLPLGNRLTSLGKTPPLQGTRGEALPSGVAAGVVAR